MPFAERSIILMKFKFFARLAATIGSTLVVLLLISLCGCNQALEEAKGDDGQQGNIEVTNGVEAGPDIIDDEPIARYYGSVALYDSFGLVNYDIKVFETDINAIEFSIKDFNDTILQHFWHELDSNFDAISIGQGLQIADVNCDSNPDFILALGILGKKEPFICFVFDPTQNQYVPLDEFDNLYSPQFLPMQQIILTQNFSIKENFNDKYFVDTCYDKYKVDGCDLQLLARLIVYSSINGDEICYTEERVVNGELQTTADHVTEEMFNWSDWESEILMYQSLCLP